MARHGLVHAYGHVSTRLSDAHFLVSAAQPLGTIVPGQGGVEVPIDGDLPAGALPEVRIHREIYRNRPEVGGVCRFQSPAIIALAALGETPRVRHGLGAYFAPHPPLWPGVALVRDDESARAVAAVMGNAAAIVLSGNGAVTAGASIEDAAALAFFLEDAARIDLALLPATVVGKKAREYTPDEVAARAVRAGGLFERMWHFLCHGDPEFTGE